jgi:tRNA threonylcarbamoyladenosine biosynthesis protein TsaB
MALILSLETATKVCSVALHKNGVLLGIKEQSGDYSHSELLNKFILQLLAETNVTFEQLEAIAVSKGPGSYTGLRIGVSTAKGLCYALNIPLIAVDTLKAMSLRAFNFVKSENATYLPLIDARRMEVYSGRYDGRQNLLSPIVAKIIDEESFNEYEGQEVYYFGDGSEKCKELFSKLNFKQLETIFPSSNELGILANNLFVVSEFEDVAYFEPYYLKDFLATTPKKLL